MGAEWPCPIPAMFHFIFERKRASRTQSPLLSQGSPAAPAVDVGQRVATASGASNGNDTKEMPP